MFGLGTKDSAKPAFSVISEISSVKPRWNKWLCSFKYIPQASCDSLFTRLGLTFSSGWGCGEATAMLGGGDATVQNANALRQNAAA
jgi:hypothetical protein